jgi:selenium metabolism protein YedF
MKRTVDARGLPCPQPVIHTRNAMREDASEIVTLVSGADQVDNVRRLAERAGWQVTVERRDDAWAVHMVRGASEAEPELTPDLTACSTPATGPTVLLVTSDRMGRGDDELGGILIRAFFHTLTELDTPPHTIILYNAGVRLAVEDSPVLEGLGVLAGKGIEVLVCGTCLDYYNLKEKLAVGTVSNMYTIAETLFAAGRIVSP